VQIKQTTYFDGKQLNFRKSLHDANRWIILLWWITFTEF
jgi:hypothetical protein